MKIDKDDIFLRLVNNICEVESFVKEYSFEVCINNEGYEDTLKKIGKIDLKYFFNIGNSDYELDYSSGTDIFMNLFKDNVIKDEYLKKMNGFPFNSSLLCLDSIKFEDKYRGNKLTQYVLSQILEYLNLDCMEIPFVLHSFPLDCSKDTSEEEIKIFLEKQVELSKYYESIGFVELSKDYNIHGRNTGCIW